MADSHHLRYRAYIDGLRALAILPVICFHADLGFSGGYVGVDVFFVISGYLISALILKELNAGEFKITHFWERRIRRIFPALAVVVLASVVGGWFWFFPDDFKKLGQSVVAQALLVSNFYFYQDAGYFAQGVDLKPLLHTWSLAVEEQFYLLFPFVLMAFRRVSRRSFAWAIVLMSAASFILSVYCGYKHPRANFYLLPTRAWELLTGSFLAAVTPPVFAARWRAEALSWTGFLAILAAVFFYTSRTPFPGATALLPCLGTAFIIWANDRTVTSVGHMLSLKPVVFIGMVSYSLYLWHWPLLVFAKYATLGPLSLGGRLTILAASFALAVLSWKLVETPFRQRAICKTRRPILIFGAASTCLLLLAGLVVYRGEGMPQRIPDAALQYLGQPHADAGAPTEHDLTLADARRGDFFPLGSVNTNYPLTLLVWGDSHAKVLSPVLDALCRAHDCRGVMASHSQTAPLADYDSEGEWSLKGDSIAFSHAILDFVATRHIRDVLIVARWDYYIDVEKGTEKLRHELESTLRALQPMGARVWILRQVPKYEWNVPKALATAVLHRRDPEKLGLTEADYRAQAAAQNPIFDKLERDFPNVKVLDPAGYFLDGSGRYRVAQDGHAIYLDSDHVSDRGALLLRPLLEPIFDGNRRTAALVGKGVNP
jgi:peptidoglycan/LPS O-acetylase OafA/YrhL